MRGWKIKSYFSACSGEQGRAFDVCRRWRFSGSVAFRCSCSSQRVIITTRRGSIFWVYLIYGSSRSQVFGNRWSFTLYTLYTLCIFSIITFLLNWTCLAVLFYCIVFGHFFIFFIIQYFLFNRLCYFIVYIVLFSYLILVFYVYSRYSNK